jgi:hypothetical protein
VDVKGPTYGWRCGATRMLECQNASDVCTAKSQDVRMQCARRPWPGQFEDVGDELHGRSFLPKLRPRAEAPAGRAGLMPQACTTSRSGQSDQDTMGD